MEDVRTEIRHAIEGIERVVDDLNEIVSDFNDVIGTINYDQYVTLLKSLRRELANLQLKAWAHELKFKIKEETEENKPSEDKISDEKSE